MYLSQIRLLNFRNYAEFSLQFPPSGAHFAGPNASGKSNLLEAIHLLCTGRSQRCASRTEMIRFSEEQCFVEGIFSRDSKAGTVTAAIGIGRDGKTSMVLDGKRISSLSQWFGMAPVIPCGPDDIEIINGSPSQRRRFLDMLISQADPLYLEELMSYELALRNRNRLLAMRIADAQTRVYEELMARHGEVLVAKRIEIMKVAQVCFSQAYAAISGNGELGQIEYLPSVAMDANGVKSWKDLYLKCIYTSRGKDIDLGFTTRGPHRDDIRISIEGRPVRQFGSQGQRRSLMISLRLCSIGCLERFRKENMILLFDDILAELDSGRAANILTLIEEKGQVFTASPFPCTSSGGGRIQLTINNGYVVAA